MYTINIYSCAILRNFLFYALLVVWTEWNVQRFAKSQNINIKLTLIIERVSKQMLLGLSKAARYNCQSLVPYLEFDLFYQKTGLNLLKYMAPDNN